MKLIQYIPSFVDHVEPMIATGTWDEILNSDLVKLYSKDKDFYRFSISDNCLMQETKNGAHWFVVGYFTDEIPNLPKWQYNKLRFEACNAKD